MPRDRRFSESQNTHLRTEIQKLVQESGSQAKAAARLGLKQGSLSQFLAGKYSASYGLVKRLSQVTGRDVVDLIGADDGGVLAASKRFWLSEQQLTNALGRLEVAILTKNYMLIEPETRAVRYAQSALSLAAALFNSERNRVLGDTPNMRDPVIAGEIEYDAPGADPLNDPAFRIWTTEMRLSFIVDSKIIEALLPYTSKEDARAAIEAARAKLDRMEADIKSLQTRRPQQGS